MPGKFVYLIPGMLLLAGCVKDKTNNETPLPPGDVPEKADSAKLIFVTSRNFTSAKGITSLTALLPTGAIKWQRDDMGNSSPSPCYYDNETIYYTPTYISMDDAGNFNSGGGYNVINYATGNNKWYIKGGTSFSSMRFRNDSIFCFEDYRHLTIYNAKTIKRVFAYTAPGEYGVSDLTFDTEGKYLYFMTNETSTTSYLNRFDMTTKTIVWKTPLGINISQLYSAPLVTKDKIYVRNGTGGLMAVNKTDGSVSWAVNGFSSARLILGNNLLYALASNKGVVALNAQTGNQVWEWPLNILSPNGFAQVGNKLIVSAGAHPVGQFVASIDATTGAQNWLKPISYNLNTSVVAGKYLYGLETGVMVNNVYTNRVMIFNTQTQTMKDSLTVTGTEVGGLRVLTWTGDFL